MKGNGNLLAHVHLGCNLSSKVLFLLFNAFALDKVHSINKLYAAAELLSRIGNILLNGALKQIAANKFHLEQAIIFIKLVAGFAAIFGSLSINAT